MSVELFAALATRNSTPGAKITALQFHASNPLTGMSAVEDMIFRKKVDVLFNSQCDPTSWVPLSEERIYKFLQGCGVPSKYRLLRLAGLRLLFPIGLALPTTHLSSSPLALASFLSNQQAYVQPFFLDTVPVTNKIRGHRKSELTCSYWSSVYNSKRRLGYENIKSEVEKKKRERPIYTKTFYRGCVASLSCRLSHLPVWHRLPCW